MESIEEIKRVRRAKKAILKRKIEEANEEIDTVAFLGLGNNLAHVAEDFLHLNAAFFGAGSGKLFDKSFVSGTRCKGQGVVFGLSGCRQAEKNGRQQAYQGTTVHGSLHG